MKIRILWVPPHEKLLKSGLVYDLADAGEAKGLIAAGEAEAVDAKTDALDDPRPAPAPEPEAPAPEPEAPAADDTGKDAK